MVRNLPFISLCVSWLFALALGAGSIFGEDAESTMPRRLGVQSTLQQGTAASTGTWYSLHSAARLSRAGSAIIPRTLARIAMIQVRIPFKAEGSS